MWWEYAIVGAAVAVSLFFVVRTAFRSGGGCADAGCGSDRCSSGEASLLQQDIPVLDRDRFGAR